MKTRTAVPAADIAAPRFLDTRAAARVLCIPPSTLVTWRCRGGGPRFRKIGTAARLIRYDLRDLEAFVAIHPTQRTTSDVGPLVAA